MSITPDTQGLVIGIAVVGLLAWLGGVVFFVAIRGFGLLEPKQRRITRKPPQQVRDDLSRAAALMEPPWDLVGGDASEATFRLETPGRPEVRLTLTEEDGGVRAELTLLHYTGYSAQLWLMLAVLAAAPVVIVGLAAWAWLRAGRAGQVWGMMAQMVHVLWPPFMFGGVHLQRRKLTRRAMDRYLTVLELL